MTHRGEVIASAEENESIIFADIGDNKHSRYQEAIRKRRQLIHSILFYFYFRSKSIGECAGWYSCHNTASL